MLGLLLIAFVGLIYVPTKVVEHDLVTVVEARLSQAGFRQIEVAADGRRVILTGTTTTTVDDEMLAALAQTSACPTLFGNLACARDVEVSVQRVAPPPPPPPTPAPVPRLTNHFVFELRAGELTLDGGVPNDEHRRTIVDQAHAHFDDVIDDLRSNQTETSTAYTQAANVALNILMHLRSGRVEYRDDRTTVSGVVRSGHRPALQTALTATTSLAFGSITVLDRAQADECDQAFATRLRQGQRLFSTGKSTIETSQAPLLEALAKIARACPVILQIESHTADTGPTTFNEQLSGQRAEAIRRALEDRGISSDRLRPLGFGEHRPLADNSTFEGRNLNERIEIRIVR